VCSGMSLAASYHEAGGMKVQKNGKISALDARRREARPERARGDAERQDSVSDDQRHRVDPSRRQKDPHQGEQARSFRIAKIPQAAPPAFRPRRGRPARWRRPSPRPGSSFRSGSRPASISASAPLISARTIARSARGS